MSTSGQWTPALVTSVHAVDHKGSFAHSQHSLGSASVLSGLLASTVLQSLAKVLRNHLQCILLVILYDPKCSSNLEHKSSQFSHGVLLHTPFCRKHNCHCITSLNICSIQDRSFGKVILRRQEGEVDLYDRLPVILLHSMTLSALGLDTVFAPVTVRQVCQFMQSFFHSPTAHRASFNILGLMALLSSVCCSAFSPAVGRSRGTNSVYPTHL